MISKKNLLLLMAALLVFTLGCSLFSAIKGEPARPPADIQRESLPREAVDADDVPQHSAPDYHAMPANMESNGDDVVMYYEDFSDTNSGWDSLSWDDAMTDSTPNMVPTISRFTVMILILGQTPACIFPKM